MSNKQKNQKKKDEKWVQVGSFQIGIERSQGGNVLVCRSVACNWSVRWRDDTMMFGLMLSIVRNADAREYLNALLTVMFVVTTYPHDLVALSEKKEMPFMEGVLELVRKQNEYEASLRPQPTEEEHEKALEDMRRLAEVTQDLMEERKEESDGGDQVHTEGA